MSQTKEVYNVKHRITATILAIALLAIASTAAPQRAAAYEYNEANNYYSQAGNGIGDNDIDLCFNNNPVWTQELMNVVASAVSYINQGLVMSAYNWGFNCSVANLKVIWNYIGANCNPPAKTSNITPNDTYVEITFNSSCTNWTWVMNPPIANGFMDAHTVMGHELMHAFGLDHEISPSTNLTLNNCYLGGRLTVISDDDWKGLKARYPTRTHKPGPFPQPAICVD